VGQYTDPLVVVVVAGSVSVVVAMAVAGMTAMMAKVRRRISLCIAFPYLSRCCMPLDAAALLTKFQPSQYLRWRGPSSLQGLPIGFD
jgi:hypothetical protein